MRRRQPFRPQRRAFFVGCEGESERSYVALLTRLAGQVGLAVHLDSMVLQPGGGDPLAIVERAAQRLAEKRRKRGAAYHANFVLLDADRRDDVPRRAAQILAVANAAELDLVWQSPCHEALLLRHLEGCATHRPVTSALAEAQLVQRWPEYHKATPAGELARRIDLAAVTRAASVENDLARLLQVVGFDMG